MDKKKLIGTIVGVVLFAALIAGATFAWLTFAASVNNGNYAAGTMEFVITYENGTDITDDMPVLTAGDTEEASSLNVHAYRSNESTIGTLQLKMTSTIDNALTTSGVLKYAVCSGTATAADCSGALATVDEENGILAVGSITQYGENILYDMNGKVDTDGNPIYMKTAADEATAYYWIYFWLNQAEITNAMTEGAGMSFEGYIHASAQQK